MEWEGSYGCGSGGGLPNRKVGKVNEVWQDGGRRKERVGD